MATQQKKNLPRMGKTLLVSPQRDSDTGIDKTNLEVFEGHVGTTERGDKYFMVFEDYMKAKDALVKLRREHNYFVKFVHYKVFFKCSQIENKELNEDFEHKQFKKIMSDFIKDNTNSHLLYTPKLFRTPDRTKYVGSGIITIDTKEAELKLLNSKELKYSKLDGNKYEVAFYRFKTQQRTREKSSGTDESNELDL